jgi:anaerobic magnesium-protoporphyrin IX monomethyl ester cyclase
MSHPDVVIIKPGSQKQLYQNLGAFSLTAIEPPLWGALIAAFLREKGFGVELIDAEVMNLDYAETAALIADIAPTLALLSVSGTNPSASTMNMTGAGAILSHLRRTAPTLKTAMTGLHVTALPEKTLQEEETDYVCIGEGFETIPHLIDALKQDGDPSEIPGLASRNGDAGFRVNPPPPPLETLDPLPMPAWDLLPIEKYRAHNWHCFGALEDRSPYGVIYTSLGCPFKCTFCCINALFGKPGIRLRSPKNVLEEIDLLVTRFGVRNIKIIDEMFALNKRHVAEICDGIIDRGYDLNLWAYARVNTVNREMLSKMKRAGINWIAYGFESGNEQVLKGVSKGYSVETAVGVAEMTREEGLYINGNYIFGLPDDNLDTMADTLALAEVINSEWVNLYAAMAYPGSQLYEEAIRTGVLLPATWEDYSQYGFSATPLPTKHLTGREVLRFRDEAFNRYYNRAAYLDMIEKRFGGDTRTHIEAMTRRRLPRKP